MPLKFLASLFSKVVTSVLSLNPITAFAAVVFGFMIAKSIKKAKKKQQQAARGISGVLVTKQGTNASIPVVYGERRVAGARVFIEASGTDGDTKNAYFHMVETIAEGPIEGLQEIYFNDTLVATSSDNGATIDYSAGSTDYSSHAATKFFDGSQTTRISGTLLGQSISSNWPSGAVGKEISYAYTVLKWNQDKFGSGVPTITYVIKGKKVPALNAEHDASLSYSANPARCIYDFLINPHYGKGIPKSLIDADASSSSFKTVMDYCDESVQKNTDASQGNQTRYETDAVLDPDVSLLDNLEDLLQTARAGILTGDKYKLIVDKPESTSNLTVLDDDSIVGNITFQQSNKKTLANRLRCTFPNRAGTLNYQDDIAILENSTLQTADGSTLSKDIILEAVADKDRVNRILNEELNQSRQSGLLEVTVDPSKLDLGVFDLVKFTNSTFGQTNKIYRIMQTILNEDNTVTLNMREYDANVYWDNNKSIITNNKDDTDH
jgi:hypothetical protein|tara:strand:- start:539 stop:2017 length:1479 start_codon:yes stop_codon:yes gene_type:complete